MTKRAIALTVLFIVSGALVFAGGGQEAPARENTDQIIVAIGAEPGSLDPIAMASAPAATIVEHVAESLIYLAPNGDLVPRLVTEWEAAADNLSWMLSLREGVVFHDGTPFDAEAVKLNLDRFLDPDSAAPFAFLLSEVSSVDVVDQYTVRLNLERPFAPIISHLSHSFIAMLSPAQIAATPAGETVMEPIGTGPYRLVEWRRGEEVVMEINEDYYGSAPAINRTIFRFVPEDAARVVALETGEVDVIMNLPPTDALRLVDDPDINVEYPSSVRVLYVGFNVSSGPFADQRVRQALNYAINKDAIVNNVLQGSGQVSTAPIVPAVFGHAVAGPYEYDPARARELLAEAGYADGFEVEFYHPTGRYPLDATIAEAVQGMLAEVGITANLQTLEWSSYLATMRVAPEDALQDMHMFGWGTVTLDADYGLYALFHGSEAAPAGWNTTYYGDETVDALLSEARTIPDRDERSAIYDEAIGIIWEDAPWLFLHDVGQINGYRSDISGLIHHPLENVFVWDASFVQ